MFKFESGVPIVAFVLNGQIRRFKFRSFQNLRPLIAAFYRPSICLCQGGFLGPSNPWPDLIWAFGLLLKSAKADGWPWIKIQTALKSGHV